MIAKEFFTLLGKAGITQGKCVDEIFTLSSSGLSIFNDTSVVSRFNTRGQISSGTLDLIKKNMDEISENFITLVGKTAKANAVYKKMFIQQAKEEADKNGVSLPATGNDTNPIILQEAFRFLLSSVIEETTGTDIIMMEPAGDINDFPQIIRTSKDLSEEKFWEIQDALLDKLSGSEYKSGIFKSLLNNFIFHDEQNIYIDNYKRIDTIGINEKEGIVEFTRNWSSELVNKSGKPFKDNIFRRFTYNGSVTDLKDINEPDNPDRWDIYEKCFISPTITINGKLYNTKECFEFFNIKTLPEKFVPGKLYNMETEFQLKEHLFENCGENIKLECEYTSQNAITGESISMVYRFKHPCKSYHLTAQLSHRTSENWRIYVAPFIQWFYTSENKDIEGKTDRKDTKDERTKQYSFSDLWAIPGTGVYYGAQFIDFPRN